MERCQEPHPCGDVGLTHWQLDYMLEFQVVQTLRRFWRSKGEEEKHRRASALGLPQITETLDNLGIGELLMKGGSGKRQVLSKV